MNLAPDGAGTMPTVSPSMSSWKLWSLAVTVTILRAWIIGEATLEGTVDPAVSAADMAELVVAAAKGASLDSRTAQAAMRQLARLLIRGSVDPKNGDGQ